jgi:hypothetical protein
MSYVAAPVLIVAIALFVPLVLQLRSFQMTSREAHDSALQLLYMHDRFWLPVTLSLVAVALHSLYSTHRIAGPLYRFRMTFNQVQKGVLPKAVKLRRNDLLGPELEGLNGMLETLRNGAEQAQKDAATLDCLISRYRAMCKESDPESDRILDEIVTVTMRLNSDSRSFKIEE